jgi:hypothetical protein
MMANPPVIVKLNPDPKEYIRAESQFLRALGLCVNRWSLVDREIYRLFRFALYRFGMKSASQAASILYYRQRQLQQHIQLAADLLVYAINDVEFREGWKPLRKEMEDLARTRNILVHHPGLRTGTSKNGKAVYTYSIYIEPYERLANKEYPGLKGKSSLEIADLKQHAESVDAMAKKLAAFLKRVNRAHQASGL